MADLLRNIDLFQNLEPEHRKWLSGFDENYLHNWEILLKDKEEAALAEAGVRRLLERNGVAVTPHEIPGEGGPDYLCTLDEYCFLVEVTHIPIQKATHVTGLVEGQEGVRCYSPLNYAITEACTKKAKQCANQSHPTLLAVATLHFDASAICFSRRHVESLLTGELSIKWKMKTDTFQPVGDLYGTTGLNIAAFLRPNKTEIEDARCSISGLLLCGIGKYPPEIRGVLHPNPARPFDPMILSNIEFGRVVVDRESGKLRVEWP